MHGRWCEDIFLVDLRFGVKKKDGGWVKMMRRVKMIENGGDRACTWIDVGIYCMRGFNFKGSLSFWTPSRCVVPWGRGSQCQYSGNLVVKHGWKIIDDFCIWLPAISLQMLSCCSSCSSSQFFNWFTSKKRDTKTPIGRHIPWVSGSSLTRTSGSTVSTGPAARRARCRRLEPLRLDAGFVDHVWCKEIQGVNPMNSKILMVVNGL